MGCNACERRIHAPGCRGALLRRSAAVGVELRFAGGGRDAVARADRPQAERGGDGSDASQDGDGSYN
jgi:hypothetical protein